MGFFLILKSLPHSSSSAPWNHLSEKNSDIEKAYWIMERKVHYSGFLEMIENPRALTEDSRSDRLSRPEITLMPKPLAIRF